MLEVANRICANEALCCGHGPLVEAALAQALVDCARELTTQDVGVKVHDNGEPYVLPPGETAWHLEVSGLDNAKRGSSYFVLCGAFFERGTPTAVWGAAPALNLRWTAQVGTTLSEHGTVDAPVEPQCLEHASVRPHYPSWLHDREDLLLWLFAVLKSTRALWMPGCPALEIFSVGSSRLDAFCHFALTPVEKACGMVVGSAPGVTASDLTGHGACLETSGLLASRTTVWPEWAGALHPFWVAALRDTPSGLVPGRSVRVA